MKITVQEFINKFRLLMGDNGDNITDAMLIETINFSFNLLSTVPKLAKAFSRHYNVNLNAKDGYKWKLEGDFRRLADIPMLNFYSIAEGGDPCPLKLCPLGVVEFYNKNGLIAAKQPGVPCEYTIEQEDDNTYLVLDRPSDVPIVVDYIAYGYPEPVTSVQDEMNLSSVIENLMLSSMKEACYAEAEDLAFSGAVLDTMSNKYIPEALQQLYHKFGVMKPVILGEP